MAFIFINWLRRKRNKIDKKVYEAYNRFCDRVVALKDPVADYDKFLAIYNEAMEEVRGLQGAEKARGAMSIIKMIVDTRLPNNCYRR